MNLFISLSKNKNKTSSKDKWNNRSSLSLSLSLFSPFFFSFILFSIFDVLRAGKKKTDSIAHPLRVSVIQFHPITSRSAGSREWEGGKSHPTPPGPRGLGSSSFFFLGSSTQPKLGQARPNIPLGKAGMGSWKRERERVESRKNSYRCRAQRGSSGFVALPRSCGVVGGGGEGK